MINAQDAYNQAIQNQANIQEKEFESVKEQIENAVLSGLLKVQLQEYSLRQKTIKTLEQLDYELTFPHQEGIIVSWEHMDPNKIEPQYWRADKRW